MARGSSKQSDIISVLAQLGEDRTPDYSTAVQALKNAQTAAADIPEGLIGAGTNIGALGKDLSTYATDDIKAQLLAASQAGMEIDPLTGQPIDATGGGVDALLEAARTAPSSGLGGMANLSTLTDYHGTLADNRRKATGELRQVAEEIQKEKERPLDLNKKLFENIQEQAKAIHAPSIERSKAKLEQYKASIKGVEATNAPQKARLNIEKLNKEIAKLQSETTYNDKQANEKDLKIQQLEAEIEASELVLANKELVDGQLQANSAVFEAHGNVEGLKDLKGKLIDNFEQGVVSTRLISRFKSLLANTLDKDHAITAADMKLIGSDRSPAAYKRLKKILTNRLATHYDGVIPGIIDRGSLGTQAELMIKSSEYAADFKLHGQFAERTLTENEKIKIGNATSASKLAIIQSQQTGASPVGQLNVLKNQEKTLQALQDESGKILIDPDIATQTLQPQRDRIFLSQPMTIEDLGLKFTDLGGPNFAKLDLQTLLSQPGWEEKLPRKAQFDSFEVALQTALQTGAGFKLDKAFLQGTSTTAKQLKLQTILSNIKGYTQAKKEATVLYGIQEQIRAIRNEVPKVVEQDRQDFNAKVIITADPVATIFELLDEKKHSNYKYLLENAPHDLREDIVKSVNNIFNTYTPVNQRHLPPGQGLDTVTRNELLYGIYRLYSVGEANGWGITWVGQTEVTVPSISATEEKIIGNWRNNISLGDLSKKPENAAAMMRRFAPKVLLPSDRAINSTIYAPETHAERTPGMTGDPRAAVVGKSNTVTPPKLQPVVKPSNAAIKAKLNPKYKTMAFDPLWNSWMDLMDKRTNLEIDFPGKVAEANKLGVQSDLLLDLIKKKFPAKYKKESSAD